MSYARWTRECDWYIFWQSSGVRSQEDSETLAVWHVSASPGDHGAQFTFSEISSMLEHADFSPVRGRSPKDDAVLAEAFQAFLKDVNEKYGNPRPVDDDKR